MMKNCRIHQNSHYFLRLIALAGSNPARAATFGHIAQRQSIPLITGWSLVRIHLCPPNFSTAGCSSGLRNLFAKQAQDGNILPKVQILLQPPFFCRCIIQRQNSGLQIRLCWFDSSYACQILLFFSILNFFIFFCFSFIISLMFSVFFQNSKFFIKENEMSSVQNFIDHGRVGAELLLPKT